MEKENKRHLKDIYNRGRRHGKADAEHGKNRCPLRGMRPDYTEKEIQAYRKGYDTGYDD